MLPRRILAIAAGSLLMLAACSSSTSSSPPASGAPASAPASAPAASTAAACSTSADAGTVAVSIKNFAFTPTPVSAKVGEAIKFSNEDSTAHTATLDDNACTTGNIDGGTAKSLVFTAAGTYPYHCAIHTQMKATITITQ